ncbi:MAG TPA: hypothetical protein DDZ80_02930 [Cyanobacteria bacterium UBA8803]|nr:hypothetical protein [Cyanobacteria bacterium UBA9273]HBL57533.1 hypothetical protein [Cyanobacteria bacterium UBA8803]
MKFVFVALTTVLTAIGITIPATAQIQSPSQDFFEQGWEQLEREIQILQGERSDSSDSLSDAEENVSPPESKPLLEVNPSSSSDPNQKPNEVEPPNQQPNQPELSN